MSSQNNYSHALQNRLPSKLPSASATFYFDEQGQYHLFAPLEVQHSNKNYLDKVSAEIPKSITELVKRG